MDQKLYKPADIMIHELGYDRSSDANWFRQMKKENDPELWQDELLTEKGRQYCINKCQRNKKKALDSNSGVYIIQYPWNIKKIKIGWSDNVFKRFKQYNTVFCGEQKLIYHLQSINKENEQKVFQFAQQCGLERNDPYEVFDYNNSKQLNCLIDLLKEQFE